MTKWPKDTSTSVQQSFYKSLALIYIILGIYNFGMEEKKKDIGKNFSSFYIWLFSSGWWWWWLKGHSNAAKTWVWRRHSTRWTKTYRLVQKNQIEKPITGSNICFFWLMWLIDWHIPTQNLTIFKKIVMMGHDLRLESDAAAPHSRPSLKDWFKNCKLLNISVTKRPKPIFDLLLVLAENQAAKAMQVGFQKKCNLTTLQSCNSSTCLKTIICNLNTSPVSFVSL